MNKMKENINKIKNIMFACSTIVMIAIIVVRAAVATMTYDEAFTYYAYAKVISDSHFSFSTFIEVLKISWANNQWLNTILIAICDFITGIEWNEFIIRFPSVVFGILYYSCLLHFNRKKEIGDIEFIFLCYSYFLNEYFSLARGYGMASFLILIALIMYNRVRRCQIGEDRTKRDYYTIILCGLLLLSCYANSIALLVCASVGIMLLIIFKKDIFELIKKYILIIVLYFFGLAFIILYHFSISKAEKPLYAATTANPLFFLGQYIRCIVGDSGEEISSFASFYNILSVILLILVVVVVIVLLKNNELKNTLLFDSFLIHYFICILAGLFFDRGGIVGRVVLPSYPLFILGLGDGLRMAFFKEKDERRTYSYLFCIFMCIVAASSFINKTQLDKMYFEDSKYYMLQSYFNKEEEDDPNYPLAVFYHSKREFEMND